MRRHLALILSLLLLVSTLGCMSAMAAEKIELEIWSYFDPELPAGKLILSQIAAVEARHENLKVTHTYFPDTELIKSLTLGATTGELPDIVGQDAGTNYNFIEMGIMADVTDYLTADGSIDQLFEGPAKMGIKDGRYYAVPHNSNATALFYNVDMLAAANVEPPKTWDELLEVCKALKESGIQYPLTICARNSEEGVYQMLPWLFSGGMAMEDVGSEAAIKAVEFLKTLLDNEYMSTEVINWAQSDTINQFMAGNCALCVNGPWQLGILNTQAPDLNYGVVELPVADETCTSISCLGGESFGITINAAEHMDLAYELVSEFCGTEGARAYAEICGSFPCRADSAAASEVLANDPILSVFAGVVEKSMPRGPSAQWPQISAIITQAVTEVLIGQTDAATAMTGAQAAIEALG